MRNGAHVGQYRFQVRILLPSLALVSASINSGWLNDGTDRHYKTKMKVCNDSSRGIYCAQAETERKALPGTAWEFSAINAFIPLKLIIWTEL